MDFGNSGFFSLNHCCSFGSSDYACFNSSSRPYMLCFRIGSSYIEPKILKPSSSSSSKFTAASSPFREDA